MEKQKIKKTTMKFWNQKKYDFIKNNATFANGLFKMKK